MRVVTKFNWATHQSDRETVMVGPQTTRVAAIFSLFVACGATFAGAHQVVDLLNQSENDGSDRKVSLCVRPGRPSAPLGWRGHAFAGFG